MIESLEEMMGSTFLLVLKVVLHSSTDISTSNVSVVIKMHHSNCVKVLLKN